MALSEPPAPELDPAQVAGFLRRHPGFLLDHPDLIPAVPTPDGTASLVQRQMATLRERNRDVGRRLEEVQGVAADNERIFTAASTLTFALMDVQTRAELDDALAMHVLGRFHLDHVICFEDGGKDAPLKHLRCLAAGELPPVATLFDVRLPLCNPCRPEEYEALFDQVYSDIRGHLPQQGFWVQPGSKGVSFLLTEPDDSTAWKTYLGVWAGYLGPGVYSVSILLQAVHWGRDALEGLRESVDLRDWAHGGYGISFESSDDWDRFRPAVLEFVDVVMKNRSTAGEVGA